MTTFYDRLRTVSKKLIDKYGQKVTYVRTTNPVPADPNKEWIVGDSVTSEVEIQMLFLPDDRDKRETKNYSDRSVVSRGNTKGYTYGLGFEPSLKDTIKRGSQVYAIESITTYQPDSTSPLLYKIRLAQ